jgi:hypothetical protein
LTLLKQRGLDQDGIKKTLAEVVNKLVEEEEMDPRDRRLKEFEDRERMSKEEAAAKEREAAELAHRAKVESDAKRYVEEITDAADRLGLVSDPFLLSKVATELKNSYEEGVTLSVENAVRLVRDQFVEQYADYVKRLPLNLKREIFGEEALKELQSAALGNAKAGGKPSQPGDTRTDSSQADDDEDPLTADAFHARRRPQEKQSQKDFFKRLQLGDY